MISDKIFVEVEFEWKHEGKQVAISGSFNEWGKKEMTKDGKRWTTTLLLAPGTYSYKFVVDDDRWCFDIEKPNFIDSVGNKNNTITIENWKTELALERSKTRDQITTEVRSAVHSDYEQKCKLEEDIHRIRLETLQLEFNNKIYELQTRGDAHTRSYTQLQEELQTTTEKLRSATATLSEKRAVIEAEVRKKYDSFVTTLHNEITQLKLELDKERTHFIDYKKKEEPDATSTTASTTTTTTATNVDKLNDE